MAGAELIAPLLPFDTSPRAICRRVLDGWVAGVRAALAARSIA